MNYFLDLKRKNDTMQVRSNNVGITTNQSGLTGTLNIVNPILTLSTSQKISTNGGVSVTNQVFPIGLESKS